MRDLIDIFIFILTLPILKVKVIHILTSNVLQKVIYIYIYIYTYRANVTIAIK